MTAREIAQDLASMCTGKHKDGRPYKDDWLDTWALLYADDSVWEEVEYELSALYLGQGFTRWPGE